jgi:hypothetical protein
MMRIRFNSVAAANSLSTGHRVRRAAPTRTPSPRDSFRREGFGRSTRRRPDTDGTRQPARDARAAARWAASAGTEPRVIVDAFGVVKTRRDDGRVIGPSRTARSARRSQQTAWQRHVPSGVRRRVLLFRSAEMAHAGDGVSFLPCLLDAGDAHRCRRFGDRVCSVGARGIEDPARRRAGSAARSVDCRVDARLVSQSAGDPDKREGGRCRAACERHRRWTQPGSRTAMEGVWDCGKSTSARHTDRHRDAQIEWNRGGHPGPEARSCARRHHRSVLLQLLAEDARTKRSPRSISGSRWNTSRKYAAKLSLHDTDEIVLHGVREVLIA